MNHQNLIYLLNSQNKNLAEKSIPSPPGETNFFKEKEEITLLKNKICIFVESSLKRAQSLVRSDEKNYKIEEYLEEIVSVISRTTKEWKNIQTAIDRPERVETKEIYLKSAIKILSDIFSHANALTQGPEKEENTETQEENIKIEEANNKYKELENKIELADKEISKLSKIGDFFGDKSIQNEMERNSEHFETLKNDHNKHERFWALIICLSAACLGWTVSLLFTMSISEEFSYQEAANIFRRIILASLPVAALKISIAKYNTERSLYITYSHRQEVLAQYNVFEAGLGDDTQGKSQLRLEVAKYIFSDPKTGYTAEPQGSEFNFSAIFSNAERNLSEKLPTKK